MVTIALLYFFGLIGTNVSSSVTFHSYLKIRNVILFETPLADWAWLYFVDCVWITNEK